MNRYRKRTMFLRLIIYSLTVIFFMNLFMGALTYLYFKNTVQHRETTQSQETLMQTKQAVESTIQEIQRTAMAISENIAVRRILVLPEGQINYTDAQSVIGMLSEKINSSNYLQSIYLYNEHVRKVISGDGVIDLEQFWDRTIIEQLREEPPYDSWLGPHTIPGFTGDKVITYALRIPEGEGSDSYVLMNIKMNPFYQTYIRLFQDTLNEVAILNEQGGTLIYNDHSSLLGAMQTQIQAAQLKGTNGWLTLTINGSSLFVSYIRSEFNDWLYIKAAPLSEVFKESDLILKVVLSISLVCLLAGAVLAILMSNRYYKPIYSFVQGIAGLRGGGKPDGKSSSRMDDLMLLRSTFSSLLQENEHAREEMKRHEAILKDHFLVGLMLGRESDPTEIRRDVQFYGFSLDETPHTVVLLHLYSLPRHGSGANREQLHLLNYKIVMLAQNFLKEQGGGEAVSLDHRRLALIMPAMEARTGNSDSAAKQQALLLTDRLGKECGVRATVGLGACREYLHELHDSYEEAKEALLFEPIAGEGSIISIWDIRLDYGGTKAWMEFTRELERLKVEIKLGNVTRSVELLTEILRSTGGKEEVNYRENKVRLGQLVFAIITTMMELNPNLKGLYEGDPYMDYNRLITKDQIHEWLRGTVIHVVTYVKDKRDNKNAELIGHICGYIESRYTEELTLQEAADQALMNPQYFSKIFKDVTGKTFLEYLTEIRLSAAVQLLQANEGRIYEVAERSGFGNKVNLIRAFKKRYNMTPTDFRKQYLQPNQT